MNIYQEEFDKINEIVTKYERLLGLIQEYSPDLDNPELNKKFFELNFECKNLYKKLHGYNFFLEDLPKKYFEPFGGSLLSLDDNYFEQHFYLEGQALAPSRYDIELKNGYFFLESLLSEKLAIEHKLNSEKDPIVKKKNETAEEETKDGFDINKLKIEPQNKKTLISYNTRKVAFVGGKDTHIVRILSLFKKKNCHKIDIQEIMNYACNDTALEFKSKFKGEKDLDRMKTFVKQQKIRNYLGDKYRVSLTCDKDYIVTLAIKVKP